MQEGWQLTLFPPFDQNGKIKVGRKKDLPTVMLTYNADTWWTEERREIKDAMLSFRTLMLIL